MTQRRIYVFIYALFFITGGAGLIYQVAWTKDLTLIFGASHQAISIVLAAFMGGLALGGYLFGRWGDRVQRPLRLYALLEIAVGFCALIMPLWLTGIKWLYVSIAQSIDGVTLSLNFFRTVLTFSAILLPTLFMGGTLPVLTRWFVRRSDELAKRVSFLYGINTLGATMGTILSGFFLLPAFGVFRTELIAVAVNCLAGVLAFYMDRRQRSEIQPAENLKMNALENTNPPAFSTRQRQALQLTFWGTAICGMCALALEVLWTRGLTISLGTTTYSFTIMLAAFLSGIALGGYLYAYLQRTSIPIFWLFSLILFLIGVNSLWVSQILPQIPQISLILTQKIYGDYEGFRPLTAWVVSYLLLFLPALFFGIAFPTAAHARFLWRQEAGRSVGDCVALNTIGAIVGALLAGFILIPGLGLQKGMHWISIILLSYSILIFCSSLREIVEHRSIAWLACAVGCLGAVILPGKLSRWDLHLLGSFRNNSGAMFLNENGRIDVKKELADTSVLYYREGRGSTVAVSQLENERFIMINGKTVASDSRSDIWLEKFMGQIPCLLHPHPKTALVIGLGAGITLGSVTVQPGIEEVHLVEIEPAVLDGARKFTHANNNALDSPNLKVNIQDGRNFLLTTNKRFDVITADPIHPWASGSTYLFTAEYYQLAKSRLNPGGIMCQWMPLYELSLENLQSIVGTFASVFEFVCIWQTHFDAILVGSVSPLVFDIPNLTARIQNPKIKEDLHRVEISDIQSLLALFAMDNNGVKHFTHDFISNTDDNLYLEFSAPYHIGKNVLTINHPIISRYRSTPPDLLHAVPAGTDSQKFLNQWQRYQEIEVASLDAELLPELSKNKNKIDSFKEVAAALETLHQRLPEYSRTNKVLGDFQLQLGIEYAVAKDNISAATWLQKALTHIPNSAWGHFQWGTFLNKQNRLAEAKEHFKQAIQLSPIYAEAWVNLGSLYKTEGNLVEAEYCWQKALEIRPAFSKAHYNLALICLKQTMTDQAMEHFQQALEENPLFPDALAGLAAIEYENGHSKRAKQLFEKALTADSSHAASHLGLGIYYQAKKQFLEAVAHFEIALQKKPQLAEAHYRLAVVLATEQRAAEALQHAIEAKKAGYPVSEEFIKQLQ